MAYAGCPWDLGDDELACVPDGWEDVEDEVQEYAIALASATLHGLSGYRVGGCPITVRPSTDPRGCAPYALWGPYGALYQPGHTGALWISAEPAACSVRLPAPVSRVDAIRVDGEELDLSDFRIDDGDLLVYQGTAECPINGDQDLQLADTEPGTWSVTYLNAIEPDSLALEAAAKLAYEFALACGGDSKKCRLPSNVTSITRTGVAMEFNAGLWPDGFTGIPEVDAWISYVNPRGRKGSSRVYSLDIPPPRIQGSSL